MDIRATYPVRPEDHGQVGDRHNREDGPQPVRRAMGKADGRRRRVRLGGRGEEGRHCNL